MKTSPKKRPANITSHNRGCGHCAECNRLGNMCRLTGEARIWGEAADAVRSMFPFALGEAMAKDFEERRKAALAESNRFTRLIYGPSADPHLATDPDERRHDEHPPQTK